MKILTTPHMDRCIGCHACSLACARMVHQQLSWYSAGIRIQSSGGLSTQFMATVCMACDPAPCAAVCPTGAFSQRPGGGVRVKRRRCIQCGDCAEACPLEAVYLDADQTPFVCIHCGRCVSFCPHNCLEMITVSSGKTDALTGEVAP